MATAPAVTTRKITGSARRSFPSFLTIRGVLRRFHAQEMVNPETGQVRWVHNLTLYHAASRRYFNCAMWQDSAVDLRPLLDAEDQEMEFHVSSVAPARNAEYGTNIGRDLPAVDWTGHVSPTLIKQYGE